MHKGEEPQKDIIITVHLIQDEQRVKVAFEIEQPEFQTKLTLDPEKRISRPLWQEKGEQTFLEDLETYGLTRLAPAFITCFRRMLTPLRALVGGQAGASVIEGTTDEPKPDSGPPAVSFWSFDLGPYKKDKLSVSCVPDGRNDAAIVINYQTVLNPADSSVVIYTHMRPMGQDPVMLQDIFSFKKSVKMRDVGPWVLQAKSKHSAAAEACGLDGKMAEGALEHALSLIWDGMHQAQAIKHEKSSKAKDNKDGGLFDLESL